MMRFAENWRISSSDQLLMHTWPQPPPPPAAAAVYNMVVHLISCQSRCVCMHSVLAAGRSLMLSAYVHHTSGAAQCSRKRGQPLKKRKSRVFWILKKKR